MSVERGQTKGGEGTRVPCLVREWHAGGPCNKSGIELCPEEKDQLGQESVSHGPLSIDEEVWIRPWNTEDKRIHDL